VSNPAYGLFSRSMPKVRAGQVIRADALNAYADAHERSRPIVATGGGITVQQLPTGFAFRLDNQVAADFLTTSSITKRSGSQLGSGTAKFQAIDGDGKYLDTGHEITIWSKWTDKAVNSGAYVTCLRVGQKWVVIDVDDCAHLT